jgi:HK97 family phage portal protein
VRLFGLDISFARKDALSIDTIIRRLEAVHETFSGVAVTPENCMQSPTVNAIVTAISRRIATLPVKVLKKTTSNNRTRKEDVPNHPVQKLLANPNDWQDRVTFWLDATSALVRHGNYYAFKSRGSTGPIRQIIPFHPSSVTIDQDLDTLAITYRASFANGAQDVYQPSQVMHARTAARDMVKGNSPVTDVREAIALEITAERMGASVFGNSAMPSMVFKHGATSLGFKSAEEEKQFIEDFQAAYSKKGRFKSMILPKGMEMDTVSVDAEKAQFLATRQYQRSVIAGAFGVPPHLVGDLSRGTFNNVEQQSLDFVMNAVLPYARVFEAAMERSLLTDEDRRAGIIIRFNLDAALRGDFKSRQEGLNIQRQAGVISANDWREEEGRNPISEEDGGEEYYRQGPSGQSADPPGDNPPSEEPPAEPSDNPDDDEAEDDSDA